MFHLTNSIHLPMLDSFIFHPLTLSLLVNVPTSIKHHDSGTIHPALRHSSSVAPFNPSIGPQDPSFSSGLWMPCLCACVHAVVCHWFFRACGCACVLEVMRKMLNEVSCVYVTSRVHCALGCYIFYWPCCFCIVLFGLTLGVSTS